MSRLEISLLGRLRVRWAASGALSIDSVNAQKLFSYLLLFRDRAHSREKLAELLWSNYQASRAKTYLRKALWQLQNALDVATCRPLLIESDWIQINPDTQLWLDLSEFERAFREIEDVPGGGIDKEAVQRLEQAVALYRGDLLEGCYDEWCLLERERLRRMHLIMLDKLSASCEANGLYEAGIQYGMEMLRHSGSHEGAHQRLMRLHYAAGDRTAALLQYELCTRIMERDLDVAPSAQTKALYEQIRRGQIGASSPAVVRQALFSHRSQLHEVKVTLERIQQQVTRDLEAVEELLEEENGS